MLVPNYMINGNETVPVCPAHAVPVTGISGGFLFHGKL